MQKRILILGNTGKMGQALEEVFSKGHAVAGKNAPAQSAWYIGADVYF